MKTLFKTITTLAFILIYFVLSAQNEGPIEAKYRANAPNLPHWVELMYAENPNIVEVQKAYENYYKTNEFVKNTFTQYYKRWMRDKWENLDENGFYKPISAEQKRRKQAKYNDLKSQQTHARSAETDWEEVGPWEYDHDATMYLSTQSPGSAHVYTVEQSASNPDVIWAGTANAGIWKSEDKGVSWHKQSKEIYLKSVYAIEIDHTNPAIVYMEGDGKIWKTTDGGATWTILGENQNFGWTRDIKMDPSNADKVIAATTTGLYKTLDAGASWTRVELGHFQEIEFHPVNHNIIYVVKQSGLHTELYRSADGGLTFAKSLNGWPGILSASTTDPFDAYDFNTGYADIQNIDLGSASLPDFTIELRIKASNWSGDPAFLSNKNWNSGLNKGLVLACNGNDWKFNMGDGSERLDLNGGYINDDQWHHICLTYDANGLKQTIQDGQIMASSSAVISTDVLSNLPLVMAQDGTTNYGFAFDGAIAEVRIWNKVLSLDEIQSWQCAQVDNTHPSFGHLLHYWPMGEGAGNTLTDTQGNFNATIQGAGAWSTNNLMDCVSLDFEAGAEQKRTEIAVSKAAPDNLYVLAAGSANDGSGLYGFYTSTDAGLSFDFKCCGDGPGGVATELNKNILGWSYDMVVSGGQYYYDLGLDVSPTDPDKIFAAGISMIRSEDGGVNWTTNGHWVSWVGEHTKHRYTHADVHDVKFFGQGDDVDMWTASDGGLYYGLPNKSGTKS